MKKNDILKAIGAGFMSAFMLFTSADVTNSQSTEYIDSHTVYVDTDIFEDDEYDVVTEDEYNLRAKQRKKASFTAKVRNGVLLAGSFLLSLLIKIILGLITGVVTKGLNLSSNTFFGFAADCIMNFAIIIILFGIAYKMIYPKKKMRDLFSVKNILYIIAVSVIIEIVQNVLNSLFTKVYAINQIIQCLFNLAIIGFAWLKTFELEGIFGKALKEALHSAGGKKIFARMALGSIGAVIIKIVFRRIQVISAYAQMVFVFIIAAMIILCGYNLFGPKKKILILK